MADILKLEHLQKLTFALNSVSDWPVNEQGRYQFFKNLECLPKLRELDIGNLLEDYRSRISTLLAPEATISYDFPALENFTFNGFDDYLKKVLIRIHGTTLKSLVFRKTEVIIRGGQDDDGEDEENEEAAREIEEFSLYKALTTLGKRHFLSLTRLQIDSSGKSFDPDDLEPLLQATGLQHLDFQRSQNLRVNDQVILKMASAWPQLEFFRLFSEPSKTPGSCPTLASIQTLARHCPNLRRLSIDLDPKVIRLNDFNTIYPLERLTLFSVMNNGKLGERRVPAVARFLAKCFPALIYAYNEVPLKSDEDGEGHWSAVFRRLLWDRDSEELDIIRSVLKLQKLNI
ncbi:hypothetical protein H1R20_g3215, partial [Candolleomyces eurysporus]